MAEAYAQAHLDNLRYHWGDVFLFSWPEPGVWLAQRREDNRVLRAEDPDQLFDLVRADVAASPSRLPRSED